MKILVLADVHGNAEALSTVLRRERDADTTVFLGDTVLGGPQPNETIELLRSLSGTMIRGNHDVEMLHPHPFAGWPPPWRAFAQWLSATLDPSAYDFIARLKPEAEYTVGGIRMFLNHGVLADSPKQALPDTPDERLVALARGSNAPLVLFGHSHIQFRRTVNGQQFINPGSVGQPRCGRRLACYGLITNGTFRHCQAEYDPRPWLEAVDRIAVLAEFPEFRADLKRGLLRGYGIGEREPWTRFAAQGYI